MATRDPKQQILPNVKSRVTSRVVDQYFKPQVEPVVSQASKELVQSLGNVIPSLAKYNNQRYDFEAEDNKIEGSEAQLKLKKDFKKAVKDGDIPEGANPYFVIGYNEMEVKEKARSFDSYLRNEYALNQGDLLDSVDPEALNTFIDDKLDVWSVENNIWGYDSKTVLEQFEPKVSGLRNELNSVLTSQRLAKYSEKFDQLLGVEFGDIINSGQLVNVPEDFVGIDADYTNRVIATKIIGSIENYSGVKDIVKINDNLIATTIANAEENLSLSMLDIPRFIETGGGNLYEIPKYKKLLEASRKKILRELDKNGTDATKAKDDKRKKDITAGKDDFIAWHREQVNEGTIPSSPEVDAWLKNNNPEKINEIETYVFSFQQSYGDRSIQDDGDALESIKRKMILDPYDTTLENIIDTAMINKDISADTNIALKKELKLQRNGVDALFLDEESYQLKLSQGMKLISGGDAFNELNPALATESFEQSFTTRARVISAYVAENFSDLPDFEQKMKFEELISQEYRTQLEIYFQTSNTQASDTDAPSLIQKARQDNMYPVQRGRVTPDNFVDFNEKNTNPDDLETIRNHTNEKADLLREKQGIIRRSQTERRELNETETAQINEINARHSELSGLINNLQFLPLDMSRTIQEGNVDVSTIPTVGNK